MLSRIICIVALALITSPNASAGPPTLQGNAFTYQGVLKQGGAPAGGVFDLEFRLFDVPTAGTALGTMALPDQTVSDGLFTVALDFGSSMFDGNERWLEIQVEGTTLNPRQKIAAAPYALHALSTAQLPAMYANAVNFTNAANVYAGDGAALANLSAAAIASGTVTSALNLSNAGNVFAGNGSGLTNLPWASLAGVPPDFADGIDGTGGWIGANGNGLVIRTLSDVAVGFNDTTNVASLVVDGPSQDASDVAIGGVNGIIAIQAGQLGGTGLRIGAKNAANPADDYAWIQTRDADGFNVSNLSLQPTNGRVGIGTTAPSWPLHIAAAEPVLVLQDTGSASTQSGYVTFWNGNPSETAWAGFGTPGSPHYSIVNARSGGNIVLSHGSGGVVHVNGTLSKNAGSFKIDHPLDPANKYLSHSFVESPDMMNIYNGDARTDGAGYATITLPEWFEVLNRDFRYQLTVIDEADSDHFVLAKVVQEVKGNAFRIRTSVPFTQVSWQVTGIRHDPYAEAHRIQVEQQKPDDERGLYQHPELYGQPPEMSMYHRPMPEPSDHPDVEE